MTDNKSAHMDVSTNSLTYNYFYKAPKIEQSPFRMNLKVISVIPY